QRRQSGDETVARDGPQTVRRRGLAGNLPRPKARASRDRRTREREEREGAGIACVRVRRHTARRRRTMTTLFEYDPDIGFRFVPNLKTRVASPDGGYLVRTNGQGFRNDREFERDDATPRVLVFGDSFTAGDGVSNGSRYSDMLEPL